MPVFKRALITGASSGLGRFIARDLALGGCEVVLCARRGAALAELAEELGERGGRAHAQVLDVTDVPAVQTAVTEWDERLGGFDLVLANAGVGLAEHAAEIGWEALDQVLCVNVRGALATLHAASGPMLRRGRGTLAGMSSLASLCGMPASGAYSASKAALSTYLETLRVDLLPRGLRVVDIRPGFVHTPMTADAQHSLPFVIGVEDAARRCVRGLERGRPVVAFPRSAAWVVRTMASLPPFLWNRVAPRIARD